MSTPVEIEFLAKDSLTSTIEKMSSKTDALSASVAEAVAEYAALQNRIIELRGNAALLESELEDLRLAGEVASPDLDQTKNIANINALERQINGLKTELKGLQAEAEQVEVAPPSVEPAQRKFNGLHNSIQQMAREMPSLAMGPQMFFMAISNNLPIFADELARAKKEYNDLIKKGEKGVPVWKQISSSLFSWQTALTTGIMLLVMYGDEISDWVAGLFGAKKAVNELNLSHKEMVEIERAGRAEMIRTTTEINSAINSIKNFTGSIDEEKEKITELNDKYGDTFGYYNTLAEWYDVLIEKGTDYVQTLYLQAKAQALVDKAIDADAQIEDKKATIAEGPGFGDYLLTLPFFASWSRNGGWENYTKGHIYATETHDITNLERDKTAWLQEAERLYAQIEEIKRNSDIGGFDRPKDPAAGVKTQQEINNLLLEAELRNQQDYINLQEDGTKKKLAQIEHDYNVRKAEIERLEADFKAFNKDKGLGNVLTTEQQNEINRANENNTLAREQQIQEVYDAEREAMREYLKEYGTFQQQKLAIAEEYAERILQAERAGDTGEANRLRRQQASEIQAAEIANIKAEIDWQGIFGGLGGLLDEQLRPTLEKLKQYAGSDDFREASLQDQQIVYDLIADLEARTTGG